LKEPVLLTDSPDLISAFGNKLVGTALTNQHAAVP